MADIRIYSTAALTSLAVADRIAELAQNSIDSRGRFTIALSGGSTPKQLYTLLATREHAERIDWSHVHVFFGDERCVPPEDEQSNNHMARLALLDHVPIPVSNIYRIHAENEPEKAAADYEMLLRDFFSRREPGAGTRFDLVILGVGDDGHTASLFPGSEALTDEQHLVRAVYAQHLSSWRITLTPKALNAAQNIYFFVTGDSKAEIIARILNPNEDAQPLPVHAIKPRTGGPIWYMDEAAARKLTSSLDWMAAQRGNLRSASESGDPEN